MKPHLTKKSLTKSGGKFRLALFLFLLLQIFYFFSSNLKVPLPDKFIEVWINSMLPKNVEVRLEKINIIGLSKIEIRQLVVENEGKQIFNFENLSFLLKPIWPIQINYSLIDSLNFSQALLLSETDGVNKIELTDFSLKNSSSKDIAYLKTDVEFGHLHSKFNIELRSFSQFLQNLLTNKGSQVSKESFNLNTLQLLKRDIVQISEKIPLLSTNITGKIDDSVGELYITQEEHNGFEYNSSKNFTSKLVWETDFTKQARFQIELLAEELPITNKNFRLNFTKPKLMASGIVNLDVKEINYLDGYFNYENLSSSGKIYGKIPNIDLVFNKRKEKVLTYLFSDSNGTKISVCVESDEQNWYANGTVDLNPTNHYLKTALPQGDLRLINGDKFYLSLFKNLVPMRKSSYQQFFVSASNFSVLEAPFGDFLMNGEVLPDLSLYIDEAIGKIGSSKVSGSYQQKWNPAEYRFLINGRCHPPDINNWLGVWWSPIWKDFVFTDEVPIGNFSISGIWGGPSGNSVTLGQVNSGSFTYKGLPVLSAEINVAVDDQSTRLTGKNIKHAHGILDGKLIFPRAMQETNLLLEFYFDGSFPVKESIGVLGDDFEQLLLDLNTTSLQCEANGQIISTEFPESSDQNQTWFDLKVSSNQPFTYDGIKFDYAFGDITQSKGITEINFDQLGIADGKAKLAIKELSTESDEVSLLIDLKNGKREKLISSFSEAFAKGDQEGINGFSLLEQNTDADENGGGIIDFSLQAEGPRSNLNYFQGTGNFIMQDFDIGSIHILGGIRSKLGAFNLPLPSDAFNFNKLEIPYILEEDRLLFNNARLLGPLSRMDATGEVNWVNEEVDLLADFKLAGNLKIPLLKQIVNLADPLSKLSKLKIQGNWKDPEWSVHLNAIPLRR